LKSLFKVINLEKIIFYIFIFYAPFQTRVIVKTEAIFNEWTSTFFYGTDILIILLLAFGARRIFLFLKKPCVVDFVLAGFIFSIFLSVFGAENKPLAFYRTIKILEFVGLYYYIASSLNLVFNFSDALKAIFFSGIFQGVIAFLQAIFQQSLGLKFLGESILQTNFQGVAVVATAGTKFLRAYGTLPHPNVLAAWLFLAIFSFYFWYLYEKQKRPIWIVLITYPFLLFSLFFTFSRVMIGLWLMGLILRLIFVSVKRKKYQLGLIFRKRLFFLVIVTVFSVLVFSFFYWPQVKSRLAVSFDELAVSERIFYNEIAGKITLSKPLLGVGAGNFVWHMLRNVDLDKPYLYQPAHNIYLLIASENGLPSLVLFLLFLVVLSYTFIKKTELAMLHYLSLFIVFVSILAAGLFDHFLWSIQQGQILLWVLLGLIYGLVIKFNSKPRSLPDIV